MLDKLTAVSIAFLVSAGCGPPSSKSEGLRSVEVPRLEATIHWTSYGVPHIIANDLESLSLGQGYAFAKLHGCVLQDLSLINIPEPTRPY